MTDPAPSDAPPTTGEPARPWRLVALVLLLAALFGAARAGGLAERFTVDGLRAQVAAAGAWGGLVFVVVFCVGELAQVPGLVFVAAAVLAWGRLAGGLLAFGAGLASVCLTFAVVRGIGGQPIGGLRRPWARRALAHLEARPVVTVAVLRTVLLMSPPLNYALALSPIRFREYLLGSALGLVLPIGVATLCFEWLLSL